MIKLEAQYADELKALTEEERQSFLDQIQSLLEFNKRWEDLQKTRSDDAKRMQEEEKSRAQAKKQLDDWIESLEREAYALEHGREAAELHYAVIDATKLAYKAGIKDIDEYVGEIVRLTEFLQEEGSKNADDFAQAMKQMGSDVVDSFVSNTENAIFAAQSFRDFLASFIEDVGRMMYRIAMTQTIYSIFPGLKTEAHGDIFSNGNVVPMQHGQIINGPTYFPMSNNRLGLMGEKPPGEAVMPLGRTSGGDLGVKVAGGAVGTNNISIHIHGVQDVQGLRRGIQRSISQIQEDLARAIER
jgi:hypothetical protein